MNDKFKSNIVELFFSRMNIEVPDEGSDFYKFINYVDKYVIEQSDRSKILENCLRESSAEIQNYVRELDEKSAQLSHSNRLAAIGEMSASLSHEINNPLFVISGNAEILKMLLEDVEMEDKEKIMESILKIENTVSRIKKISNSLKKISNEKNNYNKELVNLKDIVTESLSLYNEQIRNRQIKLTTSIHNDPLPINVATVELAQVLINLITNAKQAVESLSNMEDKYIEVDVWKDEQWAWITVKNGGPQIPVENQSKIFDSFFTTKPVGEGTGLGLSISYKIITKMEGDLYFDKSADSPKFIIKLPLND